MKIQNENKEFKKSVSFKMIVVAILAVLLLFPLSMVNSIIKEREKRQQSVVEEINTKWGEEVNVYGPILKIPYTETTELIKIDQKTKSKTTEYRKYKKYIYVFPDQLNVAANVVSQKLKRANYESVVFKDKMIFDAKFDKIDLLKKGINKTAILWDEITFLVKTSNLKGIKNEMLIDVNNIPYGMEANYKSNDHNFYALESDFIKAYEKGNTPLNVKFNMEFTGSNKVQLIPLGKVTNFTMESNWKDPSFIGNYLPGTDSKDIRSDGFDVNWKVLAVNRPFSQVHKELPNLNEYLFGTNFVVVADEYQQTERTSKYGILVIALTFLVFLLIQILSKIDIHPFQYLMIGFALVLFYTLLISISEHSSFMRSYFISASAVIVLITIYAKAILNSVKFSAFIGISLVSIYGFILVITQLENYSLLVGSVGLFTILAIVMFASRNIDFYEKMEDVTISNVWDNHE